MRPQKIITLGSLFVLTIPLTVGFAHAETATEFKAGILANVQTLLQKYEDRISTLEIENKKLSDEIQTLKDEVTAAVTTTTSPAVSSGTTTPPVVNTLTGSTASGSTIVSTIINTGTAKYDKLIQMENNALGQFLKENDIDPSATIGLFEFIEPDAFFISIDDGKNEAGVTAFPYKVLYKYDTNLTLNRIGFFKFDQHAQLYTTVSGVNPYARTPRIRIKNPTYKGKLLEEIQNTTSSTTPSALTINSIPAADVTYEQVKSAYDKNDIIGAINLSNAYLSKNPGTADIYRIQYRGYYMMGKYADSLAAVKKLETLNPSDFSKVIACDAVIIAKLAKQTSTQSYYQGLCKK